MLRNFINNDKGAALLEYALLAAGVALISAAGVSIFGHKTSDMITAVATVMPGAHADDNGPIVSGSLIETSSAADGNIQLDVLDIVANGNTPRLGNNVLGTDPGADGGFGGLILEAGE